MLGNEVLEMDTCNLTHRNVAAIVHDNLQQPDQMLGRVLKLQMKKKK